MGACYLLWEMAASGKADHVFTERLHLGTGKRRAGNKQVLFGGLLLCLGVPGCVLQASSCGCDEWDLCVSVPG